MIDSLFGTGKLEKMHFCAFLPVAGTTPPKTSNAPGDQYQVQVNPDTYSINHHVNYTRNNTPGDPGSDPKLNHISPTTLDFTIIFDGTGVVPPPAGPLDNVPLVGAIADAVTSLFGDEKGFDVMGEIKKFMAVVYEFKETQHSPRRVRLTWGRQLYDGVLTSLALNYKLFKADGTPLRVEARVTFESALPDIMRESGFKTSSPDLTHVRTVLEGDTLPLMVDTIYGTPKYYIEVAKSNKLFNFRKLHAGRSVFFPPAKKTTS